MVKLNSCIFMCLCVGCAVRIALCNVFVSDNLQELRSFYRIWVITLIVSTVIHWTTLWPTNKLFNTNDQLIKTGSTQNHLNSSISLYKELMIHSRCLEISLYQSHRFPCFLLCLCIFPCYIMIMSFCLFVSDSVSFALLLFDPFFPPEILLTLKYSFSCIFYQKNLPFIFKFLVSLILIYMK